MIEKAIKKINGEMQKDPENLYMEIIGHYIIDRCGCEEVAARVAEEGKTLSGAMDAVMKKAQTSKKGNVAILTHAVVFAEVDKYFGISQDERAQEAAMMTAGAPGGSVPAPIAKAGSGKRLALDLSDFI